MNRAPKVLLVGDYPPPAGGVAVHVEQLHRSLTEAGITVKVLDIGKGGRPVPDVLPTQSARELALRLAQHAAGGWTAHVHTSGNNRKSWMVAAAASLAFGHRSALTIHSGLAPAFLAGSTAHRSLARLALARFGHVIAVSEAVRSALEACGVSSRRLSVVPAFLASQVRPGTPPPELDAVRRRRWPLLAMAHHPSPVYGRELMFSALKELAVRRPGIGLALFGPGSDDEGVRRSAEHAGVGGLIERFGELEHGAALALIAQSDAFVRPTHADGDAISVREALALGVPCIASDVASRPAGVQVFRGGDVSHLADVIDSSLDRAAPMRAGARAVDETAARLQALYTELQRPDPIVGLSAAHP